MVDGCEIRPRIVVVDLDGTLVTVNTFREFVLFAGRRLLLRRKVLPVVWMAVAVAARKIRVVSHSKMKRRVLEAVAPCLTDDDTGLFVEGLIAHLDSRVAELLAGFKSEGCDIVMATAAPALYAGALAGRLGISECIATPTPTPGFSHWDETSGIFKLREVEKMLSAIGAELCAVITDHSDDLPLLKFNMGENILVGPSPTTLDRVRREGITVRVL